MCNATELVYVRIPADLSHTGEARWDWKPIDRCIAAMVTALQGVGIDMRGSCCGHGKADGWIELEDGRTLQIVKRAS
jgi:hypothetical protein